MSGSDGQQSGHTPPPGQSVPLAPLNADQPAAPYVAPIPGQPGPGPAPGYARPGYPPAGYPIPPASGYSDSPSGYSVPPASGYSASPGGYPGSQAGYPMQPPAGYSAPPASGYSAQPGGYPVSQHGYPVAQPGYPVSPPGYYGYAPPSGRRFWGMQFLVYIPYVGAIVTVIVSLVQRSTARRSPFPIVRENARWAANWALSFLLYVIVSYALIVIVGVSTSRSSYDSYDSYDSGPSGWIGIPVVLVFGIGIYCLVTMIRGCVVSDRAVHRPALAIPFFRD